MDDLKLKDLKDVDLYELLGIPSDANTQEVKKAYRKKALSCHPDKNPDNPRAAELFHEISRALEVLADESARAAYDKVLNAKKAAKLRTKLLDSKRQKLKEELEERERLAAEAAKGYRSFDSKTDEEKLQTEIDRLRKEGFKQVKAEQDYIRNMVVEGMRLQADKSEDDSSSQTRIKVKWSAAKHDPSNGGYNSENLRRMFSKYGDIMALIVSTKKMGSALIEFKTKEAAKMAYEMEQGLFKNPLKVEKLVAERDHKTSSDTNRGPTLADLNTNTKSTNQSGIFPSMKKTVPENTSSMPSFSFSPNLSGAAAQSLDTDYESVVLQRMRQAQERKRLMEEMLKEDKESD